ncbi:hypothetical protein H4219_001795 [Mycoemilia scoparia]|uniref:Cullin family profile domain-containing protein n=1 Tax=Mycoemilia scoparia TaxID=417184 RepID=A0A9W8A2S5_9FUNG|nr:hypothetical protein H4219_001795 [Mycoemilia scoparia]
MIQPTKKGGIRIRPAKRLSSDKGKTELFDKLASAIRLIYQHNASKLSFEQLYTCAYKLVQNGWGEYLYNGLRKAISEEVKNAATKNILGPKNDACIRTDPIASIEFLKALRQLWGDHVMSMLVIKDILIYVDRQYVKNAEVPLVYDMGLGIFRDEIITNKDWDVTSLLQRIILDMVKSDRGDEEIDRGLLRAIVDMLQELTDNISFSKRDLYQASIEPSILDATKMYYQNKAKMWIASLSTASYINKIQESLQKEDVIANSYLSSDTSVQLRKIVLEETIKAYDNQILILQGNGLNALIDSDEYIIISTVYSTYSECGDSIDCLRRVIKEHITLNGSKINATNDEILAASSAPKSGGDSNKSSNAQTRLTLGTKAAIALKWSQKTLDMYSKYMKLHKNALKSDQAFQLVINKAFSEFIDANPRSAEFISLYIDDCLKKGPKEVTGNELDKTIDGIITLAKLLKSRDLFEHYYAQHLSKRLLFGKSSSKETELSAISKIKSFSEPQFIKKLETMFKDVTISAELTQDFSSYLKQQSEAVDSFPLVPSILTNTIWPIPKPKGLDTPEINKDESQNGAETLTKNEVQLPEQFKRAVDAFAEFYKTRFSGRQLSWYYHMGTVEIRTRFKTRIHELTVSTYQAFILTLYSEMNHDDSDEQANSLSFEEIQTKLNIPEPELIRQLQSLACGKYKILIKEPKSKQVSTTDKFKFNINFTANMTRIKVPLILASARVETETERKETNTKVAQERKHLVDAAIVRIMKSRKTQDHYGLVMETIEQLKSRFTPTPKEIKRHIENLIERDYLERLPGELSKYQYVA